MLPDRHPVGASVTVYYDPANPQNAVLEREFPKSVWFVGVGCFLLSVAVPLLAAFLYFNGVAWLGSHLPNPSRAPFVAAAGGFGLLVLLFAVGFTGAVRQASKWPVTRGRITASGVDAYRNYRENTSVSGRRRRYYRTSVTYTYTVHGRQYQGDRLTIGAVVSATSPFLSKRTAAKYPVGREVDVYYNPKRPSDSVLHPWSWLHVLPWLVAAAMLTFTWAVATGRM